MKNEIILSAFTIEGEISKINWENEAQKTAYEGAVAANLEEKYNKIFKELDEKVASSEISEDEAEKILAEHRNKVRIEFIEHNQDLVDMDNPHMRGTAKIKLIF